MSGGGAVKSGGSATLRCPYDLEGAQLYSIRWYRNEDEFYRYVPKESPPAMVFSLPGIHVDLSASNDQRVTLTGIHRQLAGKFHCEVSADAPLFHTEIQSTSLEVVDVPVSGPFLTVDRQRISAGESIRANCSSPSSYPAANLTWYINSEKINLTHTTILPENPKLWESSSSFSIIEISTEEEIQYPRYQVGGNFQETSSSQLKSPSQYPEITVYTAYSSYPPENSDKRDFESYVPPYYQEYRKQNGESDGVEPEVQRKTDSVVSPSLPLKVMRVRMQPGFGRQLKVKCEATIYGVYKSTSDLITITEETPNIALVMGQSSAGSSTKNANMGYVIQSLCLIFIYVWKSLDSGR